MIWSFQDIAQCSVCNVSNKAGNSWHACETQAKTACYEIAKGQTSNPFRYETLNSERPRKSLIKRPFGKPKIKTIRWKRINSILSVPRSSSSEAQINENKKTRPIKIQMIFVELPFAQNAIDIVPRRAEPN